MKRTLKSALSILLVLSLIFSLVPAAFAADYDDESGASYFDFDAAEYIVDEDAGELKVKIVRFGGTDSEVDVSFKVADFLSDYGYDYEVLDEYGDALDKVYGEKPEYSELVNEDEESSDEEEYSDEDRSGADEYIEDEYVDEEYYDDEEEEDEYLDEEESFVEEDEYSDEEDIYTENSFVDEDIVNEDKKEISTGSSLLDAQAEFLDLPLDTAENYEEEAFNETLNDMYNYFLVAQGASGVVHFGEGEKEKEITIKIFDNDDAESDKIFMLALMSTSTDDTSLAPNATTYVNILDDEDYKAPVYTILEDELYLTSDSPEGYITVVREEGTQYFSTAYVSTITQTAPTSAYEVLDAKTVSFVPGETEKQVKITAKDFSNDCYFGVRLEAMEPAEVDNHYADVYILSSGAYNVSLMSDMPMLMADNDVLGSNEVVYHDFTTFPSGWKTDISGDGSAWIGDDNNLYVKQYDKNDHSMFVTNSKLNLVGVNKLRYSMYITNVSRGFNSRYDGYKTYFETDSDQTFSGSLESNCLSGNHGWKEYDLGISNKSGDSAYVKFGVKPTSGGYDNPQATLDWIKIYYAEYTFAPKDSAEYFNRQIYDFTQGTPHVYDAIYDGESTRNYNPGSVTVKQGSRDVGRFYANTNSTLTIASAQYSKNAEKGIYLKGVYFAKSGLSPNEIIDSTGEYRTKEVYYVAANGSHEVVFTPNTDFLKRLRDKGVISDVHNGADIAIYPVFEQKTVEIRFENADRDDTNSSTKGKYNSSNLNSHFTNIIEAYEAGNLTKKLHAGWLDYYAFNVPVGSVIRLQYIPNGDRTPAGTVYWESGKSGTVTYYKEGEKRVSSTEAGGEAITETDYTKADVVAGNNGISIKPETGEQTFYVGYSPKSYNTIMNTIDPDTGDYIISREDGLTEVVNDTTGGEINASSGKDGSLYLDSPYVGKKYDLTAYAPDGYYVSWAHMTGDTNNDGTVGNSGDDDITKRNDRNNSQNPLYIYGNTINLTTDLDNTRYYYEFVPKSNSATVIQNGQVVREKTTFYNLANHIKTTEYEPLDAVYMNIAGFVGQTDGNGNYSIPMMGLPSWGTISASITTDEGVSYNATASIEAGTFMVLPALEVFNAVGTSASYATKNGSISKTFITVENDMLTVKATVSSDSAIKPVGARFFIYDNNGSVEVDCSEDANYTTSSYTAGNNFTAQLTFNPSMDMEFGYSVYVQFCDQNGKWYAPINVGYDFFAPLDLAEFIFPLIGSQSFEDTMTSGFVSDIIGNPLSDIDVGSISEFDITTSTYTPAGINPDDAAEFTWQKTDYGFGWDTTFAWLSSKDNEAKDDEKLLKFLKDLYDGKTKANKVPGKSKYETKSNFSWNITPGVGFNLQLSSRAVNGEQKAYFEDLVFFVELNLGFTAQQTIKLPVGISMLIRGDLSGKIAGVYHMYVDYKDSYETEDAVPYTSEDFGLFKKFESSVRREGYIFIDPHIGVELGVGVAIFYVKGGADFDVNIDMHFVEDEMMSYGDIWIDLHWGIQITTFEIYENDIWGDTFELWKDGVDGPIDFDYKDAETYALMRASEFMEPEEDAKLVTDQLINRDYLENRSEWLGEYPMVMASIDASDATSETVLMTGTTDNPQMSVAKINDDELLLVFVDDDPARSEVNMRTLYYSIGTVSDGAVIWGMPEMVDDDGTMDDYPNVQDIGDKILVTWSSAEIIHEDDATLDEVLPTLNIEAAFFDKDTKTFSDAQQLTKTNDADYTADVFPRAAYDEDSDRLILYYTKTEYTDKSFEELESITSESASPSVLAYLFYDMDEERWENTPEDYTEDFSDEYKEDWYGQRFLDVRTDKTGPMMRIVDTDAICYNGLALFAWTVDHDRDLNTVNDRDVFMQIYNFSEESFTHIIRVTNESGIYSLPKFARSNNSTYLFFGAQDEGSDSGDIRYINVTDVISNDKFEKVENGDNEYYVLQYERETFETDENGDVVNEDTEIAVINAKTAASCDNITEFDVCVDANGQMYLLWTDTVDGAREIHAAMYNGSDENDDDEWNEENFEGTDEDTAWSEPFVITDNEENTFYSGIGLAVVNGTMYIGGAKGVSNDESQNVFVAVKHTPYADVNVTDVVIEQQYPMPGDTVTVIATVTNEGMLPYEDEIVVEFEKNGEYIGSEVVPNILYGGASADVYMAVEIGSDEELSDVEITAYIDGEGKSVIIEPKADINVLDQSIAVYTEGYNLVERIAYRADIENNGNAASDEITLVAHVGDKVIREYTVPSIEARDFTSVDMTVLIPDRLYEIKNGIGHADLTVTATIGEDIIFEHTETVKREFDQEAIELLSEVTGISNTEFAITPEETAVIQPDIEGVEEGELRVRWLNSSDPDVVSINLLNTVTAKGEGKATLTGVVVPNREIIRFGTSGGFEHTDWQTIIEEDELITVTATVHVNEYGIIPPDVDGVGFSGSIASSYTVSFDTNGGSKVGDVVVSENGTINEPAEPTRDGYIFEGWYADEDCTEPFDFDEKVTGQVQIYAKWTKDTSEDETNKDNTENENPFDDVTKADWFYDSVMYVTENKLFNGVSSDKFAPANPLTRAMLVTVLYRAEGQPDVNGASEFADVDLNEYYADAVAWAEDNGIVNGVTDTEFRPDDEISREQIAAIMFRYAQAKGIADETVLSDVLGYSDEAEISDWAKSAVAFCKDTGLMLGNELGEFNPDDNATRAEAATVLMRFIEYIKAAQ